MATDTLIPDSLISEIEALAQREHRQPRELVEEAVRQYLTERQLFRRDEVHRQIAQGLESLHQGKALDGEQVMAELLADLEGP